MEAIRRYHMQLPRAVEFNGELFRRSRRRMLARARSFRSSQEHDVPRSFRSAHLSRHVVFPSR